MIDQYLKHQFCIPFMLHYHHTKYHPKRKSGSRDIQIWKRPNHISGDLGHFWPFLAIFGQIRIFLKNLIRPLLNPYTPLTSCKKSETTNEAILRKIPKTSFLGLFWPFLAIFGQIRIFPKNRAPSLFSIYGPLTSCKNQKNLMTQSWEKLRTD